MGALALERLSAAIGPTLVFHPINTSTTTAGALNHECGADFVKTEQRLPPSVAAAGTLVDPYTRGCSFDGDADRIIYYYLENGKTFRLLDGDKIAVLLATYFVDLVNEATRLEEENTITVGVIQTAYANGQSTRFLESVGGVLSHRVILSDDGIRTSGTSPWHACPLA